MDAENVQASVAAWQMGAISRDTLLHNFRQGEILPPGRTNEQELELVRKEPPPQTGVWAKALRAEEASKAAEPSRN